MTWRDTRARSPARALALALVVATLALAPALAQARAQSPRTFEMEVHLHDGPLHLAPDAMGAEVGDTLKLSVHNAGTIAHDLAFCGNDACSEKWGFIAPLQPDAWANLTVEVKAAGPHKYVCTIPGHEQGGMRGTLTVAGADVPAAKGLPGAAFIATLMTLAGLALLRRRAP